MGRKKSQDKADKRQWIELYTLNGWYVNYISGKLLTIFL